MRLRRWTAAVAVALSLATAAPAIAAGPVRGPDISNNQGCAVNLHSIYKAGARFIGLKATEGVSFTDRCFSGYWKAARHEGLIPMAYDFAHLTTDPRAEARKFVQVVNGAGGFEHAVAVVDVEAHSGGSVAHNRQWVQAWINEVARTGRPAKILVYTAPFFWNPHLGCWRPRGAGLWVATYGPRPSIPCGWGGWDFWQYTDGRYGPQPRSIGAGPMDVSVFSGDYESLRTFTGIIAEHPFASRSLRVGSTGSDVEQFQLALNHRLAARHRKRITDDGHYGTRTERAKHFAAYRLGLPLGTVKRRGATPRVLELIAHPGLRSVADKRRARYRD